MAQYNVPSADDFKRLTTDPRTALLNAVPGDIQQTASLVDLLQQKKLQRDKETLALQQELDKIKQQKQAKAEQNQLAQLQQPISSTTPATQGNLVPQVNLGQVANVNPETNQVMQTGPQIAGTIENARPSALNKVASLVNPADAAKQILAPDKFATAETDKGVVAYNKSNPSEQTVLGGVKPSVNAEDRALNHQDKLEKDYRDMLNKQLSNRSGGLGLQDAKVNQAIDLKNLIRQSYDPNTKQYNIPPSMHTELALGLARLLSPSGNVGVELEQQLRQKTLKEGLAGAAIFLGFDPAKVGGTTQSVSQFFAHAIDRQGQVAQGLRDKYVGDLKKRAPTGLSASRRKYLADSELGSNYNDVSESSNTARTSPGGHSYQVVE